MTWSILQGSAFCLPVEDGSVDCIVTSPPYFRLREYPGDNSEHPLGLEATPDLYIARMVEVAREWWRVLKPWGTVWVNMGDSYTLGKPRLDEDFVPGGKHNSNRPSFRRDRRPREDDPHRAAPGLKPGDLMGMPWRLAFALQAAGWHLRSAITWAKGVSFCDSYSGSVMPESVKGWRWERCRVKVGKGGWSTGGQKSGTVSTGRSVDDMNKLGMLAKWQDCPGCDSCRPNDGYVLRKGSWRPTSGYEMIFMLAKSPDYYCDHVAVAESSRTDPDSKSRFGFGGGKNQTRDQARSSEPGKPWAPAPTRNPRNVWYLPADPRDLTGWSDLWAVGTEGNSDEFCAACDTLFQGSDKKKIRVTCGNCGKVSGGHLKGCRHCNTKRGPKDIKTCPRCDSTDGWVAHFATFPTRLPKIAIQAGTSERGNCPACGMPWVRVVESGSTYDGNRSDSSVYTGQAYENPQSGVRGPKRNLESGKSTTLGWRPSCRCLSDDIALYAGSPDDGKPIPFDPVLAVVLDSFSGSGTVVMQAHRMDRHGIGVEISPEYCRMSRARIEADTGEAPEMVDVDGREGEQLDWIRNQEE